MRLWGIRIGLLIAVAITLPMMAYQIYVESPALQSTQFLSQVFLGVALLVRALETRANGKSGEAVDLPPSIGPRVT